ncbi:MAG: hypothetical protein COA44_15320 [Arcobacter sp.]|nr:MAG: hypothetical protein COA44_15320 [Arcobacter sp.]
MAHEDKLIGELDKLKTSFSTTIEKIEKDIKRKDKIMERSDKRQRKEYDELQDKLEEVKDLNKEIEDNQREAVFQMGVIGETRSKETANHVIRVAEYSYILAKAYGLDAKESDILRQASPLHDIGKVGIPDAVLNKPGRFNEEEREIMNAHAKMGYDMFIKLSGAIYQAAAHVSYEHHEKWDGSGYPRGLKGEDIHIYGRITAVADVFDALGSDRVYKKAWDDEGIFKLFKEESGSHFDPRLIELFFENLDEFKKVRDSFKDEYKEGLVH